MRLQVTDTGSGVAPEVYVRVFEPFFTTKSVGQGTGLGLATCASIVRQAGGYIGLTSSPSGTTFEVHLPVAAPFTNPAARDGKAHARGDETVLMVDDEPSVRVLMQRVLRSLGYDVLVASDGREMARKGSRPHHLHQFDGSHYSHDTFEVVGQNVQTHFGTDPLQGLGQEMRAAHP